MDDGWMVDDSDDHELINLGLISSWCLKLTSQDVRHPAKSVYCQTQLCRSQMSQVVPMPEPVANEVGSSDVWMKLMSLYWDKSWIPDNSRSFFHLFRYGMMVQLWSHLLIFNVNCVGHSFAGFNLDVYRHWMISRKSTPMTFIIFHWLSVSPTSNNTTHAIYMYIYIYTLSTFEYYTYT